MAKQKSTTKFQKLLNKFEPRSRLIQNLKSTYKRNEIKFNFNQARKLTNQQLRNKIATIIFKKRNILVTKKLEEKTDLIKKVSKFNVIYGDEQDVRKLRRLMTSAVGPYSIKMEGKERTLFKGRKRVGNYDNDNLIIEEHKRWREIKIKKVEGKKIEPITKRYDITLDVDYRYNEYGGRKNGLIITTYQNKEEKELFKDFNEKDRKTGNPIIKLWTEKKDIFGDWGYEYPEADMKFSSFMTNLINVVASEIDYREKSESNSTIHIQAMSLVGQIRITDVDPNKIKMKFVNFAYSDRAFGKIVDDSGECAINMLKQYANKEKLIKWFNDNDISYQYGLCNYDILEFCKDHRISMHAVDMEFNKLLSYIPENGDHHEKALIYVSSNAHCYEIKKKKFRDFIAYCKVGSSIRENNENKQIVSTLTHKKKKKPSLVTYQPLLLAEGIAGYKQFCDLKQGKYYVLNEKGLDRKNGPQDIFTKIIEMDETIPLHTKKNGDTIYMKYNGIELYYNPRTIDCLHIGKLLGIKNAFLYGIGHLFRRLLARDGCDFIDALSVYNQRTRTIFNDHCPSNPLIWAPENINEAKMKKYKEQKKLVSVDFSKQYAYIMKTFPMPKYTGHEIETEYKGDPLKLGYYKLEFTPKQLLQSEAKEPHIFSGNGYYCNELVNYGLETKQCTKDNIKTEILASEKVYLNKWVKTMFSKKNEAISKMAICILAGSLGMRDTTSNSSVIVNNALDACYYAKRYGGKAETVRYGENIVLYNVDCNEEVHFQQSGRPAFCNIVQIGRMLIHKLAMQMLKVPGKILSIRVDSVHYLLDSQRGRKLISVDIKSKSKAKIGDIRKEKFKTKVNQIPWKVNSLLLLEEKAFDWDVCEMDEWEPEDVYMFDDFIDQEDGFLKDGGLVHGLAGSGKSVFSERLCEAIERQGLKVKKLAFTNTAALNIIGETINKFTRLGIEKTAKVQTKHLNNIARIYDYLLIDECSMLDDRILSILNLLKLKGCKIIMVGDYWQIPSVGSKLTSEQLYNSPMVKDLCNRKQVSLTENYRADKKFVEECRSGNYDEKSFRQDGDLDKCNIVKYNKTRKIINAKCANKYGKMGTVGSRFIIDKTIILNGTRYYKNMLFEIVEKKGNDGLIKELYRKNGYKNIQLDGIDLKKLLKCSQLGYAITTYKVQGMTIKEQYTIWDYLAMNKNHKYVAMTRTDDKQKIKLEFNKAYSDRTGYIYKMVGCDTGLIYIGQTFKSINERYIEHVGDKDILADELHLKMRDEEFKIILIEEVKGANIEDLDLLEQFYIDKYNSVNLGLNSNL